MGQEDQTVICPQCGSSASGWRDVYQRFYRLHRPDPREGWVWPQVYRCLCCGMLFGSPYPASIEADPPLDKQATSAVE